MWWEPVEGSLTHRGLTPTGQTKRAEGRVGCSRQKHSMQRHTGEGEHDRFQKLSEHECACHGRSDGDEVVIMQGRSRASGEALWVPAQESGAVSGTLPGLRDLGVQVEGAGGEFVGLGRPGRWTALWDTGPAWEQAWNWRGRLRAEVLHGWSGAGEWGRV